MAMCMMAVALAISRAEAIPFLVAESSGQEIHGDLYVLPLDDMNDILHARNLIQFGFAIGAPIAVAEIAKGADGINRDLLSAGAPEWSWHVTGFLGFVDYTIEILDGWPSFVESNVDGWIDNTGGFVGFWSYTVVAEVPEPATIGLLGVWADWPCSNIGA